MQGGTGTSSAAAGLQPSSADAEEAASPAGSPPPAASSTSRDSEAAGASQDPALGPQAGAAALDLASELEATKRSLKRTTRMHQTLLACVRMGQSRPSQEAMFAETVRILVELANFKLAYMVRVDRSTGVLVPVAQAGSPLDLVRPVPISDAGDPAQRGPANEVLIRNASYVFDDVQQSGLCPSWQQAMLRANLFSGMALPIRLGNEIIAILVVYEGETGGFQGEAVDVLNVVAAGLSSLLKMYMHEELRRQAERALQDHGMLLQSVINSSPDLITIKDTEHRYRFANLAAARAMHLTPEQMVGKSALDVKLDPASTLGDGADIARKMLAIDREVMASGQTERLADQTLLIHGEPRICDILKVPMRDRQDRVWGVLEFVQDITLRRQAEASLRSHEGHLQLLFDHAPVALAMLDRDMRYLHASQRWLDDYRVSGEALRGRCHYDVYPEIPEHWKRVHQRSLKGEVVQAEAEKFVHADGRVQWLRWETRPWLQNDGSIGGIVIFTEDITARRESEEVRRLLSLALSVAANAIVITDPQGQIEWMNPAFAAISGYSSAEALGQNITQLVRSGLHEHSFYEAMHRTISSGQPWQGELTNRRKDGSLYSEIMSITPLLEADGKISHFIAIKQDISDQKRMEALLLRTQRLESVGRLAGGLAHDLNNLLTPMLMAPPMLRMFVQDAIALESLDNIEACARRGANIIRQLLTFSRGQPGEKVPVQLRMLLRDMMRLMQEAFPKNITLKQSVPRDLPTVLGDATQLHQVLMNLCVNARDAMPQGGTLSLSLQTVSVGAEQANAHGVEPGLYVLLTASDTGIGIPKQNLEQIFDPFFTTKNVGEGTGLGLSTSLGIVQGHQGFIEVESVVGHGSQFRIYLPASEPVSVHPAAGSGPLQPQGNGELVLVVDDEELARRATCRLLEQAGYRTIEASNGEEGLQIWRQHRASTRILVTDLMMPYRDGVSLLRELEQEPPSQPPLRVVVITGYLSDPTILNGLHEAGYVTLTKPFSASSLLDALLRATAPAKLTQTRT